MKISANGYTFDADCAGEAGWPLVMMLHGFPQTRHTWRHQLKPLAEAGYYAVAPDQRGYSTGARPVGKTNYATQMLVADALQMATALGYQRFHLVGHDWGGQLSWLLAALHPDRVISLTVLSRPHPAAFARAMRQDTAQAGRSGHHKAFQDENMAAHMLADDGRRLRGMLRDQHVPDKDITAYLSVLGQEQALDAALNWYRAGPGGASSLSAADVPPVDLSVLYIWGDADATVGPVAALGTAEFVTGSYQLEVLAGVGHFVTDQVRDEVTHPLIEHLNRNG